MKKWVTLFERYEDFHFVKDVGQIPFHAYKELGFNAELWRKGDADVGEEFNGIFLKSIKAKNKNTEISINIIFEIIKNSRKIDVFQLFHFRKYSLIYAFFYKLFNPFGRVVIKCDASDEEPVFEGIKWFFLLIIFRHIIDLVTAEHRIVVNFFIRKGFNVDYIPNGVCSDLYYLESCEKNITPTIIFVGKSGDDRKNAFSAIEALAELPKEMEWRAFFVGGETTDFKKQYDEFTSEGREYLEKKIEFKGFLSDSREMKSLYDRSHIFVMTSKKEGYPLSTIEASWSGCYPVLSKYSGGRDLIESSKGYIYQDKDDLVEKLQYLIENIQITIIEGRECESYVKKHNDWRVNIRKMVEATDD